MKYSKKKFSSRAEMLKFVTDCEHEFEAKLAAAVKEVCDTEELKVIGLSGPTCSGKTTTAKKLIDALEARGKNVHIVSIDDFFKNVKKPDYENDDEQVDFDSINAIDLPAFEECINEIFECRPSHIPHFDFITGKRTGYTEIQPDPNDLYIFEGIQAVYPEITALLHRFNSLGIYIRAESEIDIEGTVFESNEIRLMRRIVRDYNFRGAEPAYTFFLWEGVRKNEEESIFPNVAGCDIKLDSTMAYEINLLSQFLSPLLAAVPTDSEYRPYAETLMKKLEGIECVEQSMIPNNSLYYEFIKRI